MTTTEVLYAEKAYESLTSLMALTDAHHFGVALPENNPSYIRRCLEITLVELRKWYGPVSKKICLSGLTPSKDSPKIPLQKTPIGQLPFHNSES